MNDLQVIDASDVHMADMCQVEQILGKLAVEVGVEQFLYYSGGAGSSPAAASVGSTTDGTPSATNVPSAVDNSSRVTSSKSAISMC